LYYKTKGGNKLFNFTKKKVLSLTLATALGAISVASVSGAAFFDFSARTSVTGTLTAKASFTPSASTTGVQGLRLDPDKHVKQSWVRITEGAYDSGIVGSYTATSTSDTNTYSATTSKFNSPFYDAVSDYGWKYF
ncbi:hypothetical protein, partial [Saccharibacillus sacchari]